MQRGHQILKALKDDIYHLLMPLNSQTVCVCCFCFSPKATNMSTILLFIVFAKCFALYIQLYCMNRFLYSPRLSGWKTRWLSEMTPSSGRSVSRVSAPWRSESLATLTEVCTPAEPRMITERQLSAASWRSNVSQDLKAVLKSEV